jgi:RsiW-degrading membrane proteinase PrsW (M82 family)/Flp pilus assembly protein TadD
MFKSFLALLIGSIAIIFIANTLFTEPLITEPEVPITNKFQLLEEFKTAKDTLDIHLHYRNVEAHFKKPFFQNLSYGLIYRDDEAIKSYYNVFYYHKNPDVSDMGKLFKALIYNREDHPNFASKELLEIQNTQLPYYKSELGYIAYRYGENEKAAQLFEEELRRDSNNEFSILYLSKIYHRTNQYQKLGALFQENRKELLMPYLNEIYLINGMYGEYVSLLIHSLPFNWINILAAALIAIVWMMYLKEVSIFESFPLIPILTTFFIGLFFTVFVFFFYDVIHVYFHITKDWRATSQFVYCFTGIGLVEEISKFIPVLIALKIFRNSIKTPLGYVLIACSSALAFATLENTLYFEYYSGDVIHYRAFLCIAGHMFTTCSIVYGLKIVSFPRKNYDLKYGFLFFLFAIGVHGFYDAFLIVKSIKVLWWISFLIALFEVYGLYKIINYSLNVSPHFDSTKKINENFVKTILLIGFTSILLFEFVLSSLQFGFTTAYGNFITSLLPFSLMLIFWISSLSKYNLVQHLRTGIFSSFHSFKFDYLTFQQLSVKFNSSLPAIDQINSFERIQVSQKGIYILLHTEIPYEGHEWLILQPITLNTKKGMRFIDANVYAVKNQANFLQPEFNIKDLTKLGKSNVTILNDPPRKEHWTDKLGVFSIFGAILVFIFLFVLYMNFRSARIAFEYANNWLGDKSISNAGENIDYALWKDPDYTDAKFMNLKLLLYVDDYQEILKQAELIEPTTEKMKMGLDHLKVRAYLGLNRKEEAFTLLQKMVDSKKVASDSAYFLLAQFYLERNNLFQTMSLLSRFEENVPLNKTSAAKLRLKSKCYLKKMEYSDALNTLVQLEKSIYQPDGSFYEDVAKCYMENGDTNLACSYWQKGASLQSPESMTQIGTWCYSRQTDSTAKPVK